MTRFVADFHLHVYKVYPLELLLQSLFDNLNRAIGPARGPGPVIKAAFLAERRRYRIFHEWQLGHFKVRGFTLTHLNPQTLQVTRSDGDSLLLFAGRQVATTEGLELLSLVTDADIPDALPFADAAQRVLDTGGIPVLPWAPGKWGGARKAIIRKGIESLADRGLLICDASIRPAFFPDPALFRVARRLGVPVVAGTDTYPVTGEEVLVGRYATLLETDEPVQSAAEDLPRLVRDRRFKTCRRIGRRSHLPAAAQRWLIHMFGHGQQINER
ncbi:MAG: hypothetical protein R6X19_04275 [Kiritimatiellia bacterium]